MNPTAERARAVALKAHKAELEKAYKCGDKWMNRAFMSYIASFLLALALMAVCLLGLNIDHWQTDPPPPLQKVEVISYGFQDREHVWRSYDTGEVIEVKKWK